jgi:hypothetical protein
MSETELAIDEEPIRPDVAPPLKSLWRIVPYYSLLLFGGLLVVLSVLGMIVITGVSLFAVLIRHQPVSARTLVQVLAAQCLMVPAGLLWMRSAKAIRWRQWRMLIATLLTGYVCGASAAFLMEKSDQKRESRNLQDGIEL